MPTIELVDSQWTRTAVSFVESSSIKWDAILSNASLESNGAYIDIRVRPEMSGMIEKFKSYLAVAKPLYFPALFIDGVRHIYFIPTLVNGSYVLRTKLSPSTLQTRDQFNVNVLQGLPVLVK